MVRRSIFQLWAREQGVARPFRILTGLEPEERRRIAEHLGIRLNMAWSEGVDQALLDLEGTHQRPPAKLREALRPEAEACLIIGKDIKGIQARSHGALRKLNPMAKNHVWEEVLQSILTEFKIACPSRRSEDMESAIFEFVADEALTKMSAEDKKGMEDLLKREPEFVKKLRDSGFGSKGVRLVAAGFSKMTLRQGFGAYITAGKVAAAANRKLGTRLVMTTVTTGLKTALRGLNVLLWAWVAADVLGWIFGASRRRLLTVVAEMRMADLIAEM